MADFQTKKKKKKIPLPLEGMWKIEQGKKISEGHVLILCSKEKERGYSVRKR